MTCAPGSGGVPNLFWPSFGLPRDEMNDIDVLTSSTGTAGNDGNDVGDGSAGTGTAPSSGCAPVAVSLRAVAWARSSWH